MGGSFTRKMKQNERVTVGLIPAETNNVLVKLRTDKDVDAELWTANGKREIAIVAWMVGKINSPTKASIKFAGAQIPRSAKGPRPRRARKPRPSTMPRPPSSTR